MTRQTLLVFTTIPIFFFAALLQNPGDVEPKEKKIGTEKIGKALSEQLSGNVVIGQIQTRDKVVVIRSGKNGPLYTVKSKDGAVLAEDIIADEVNLKFPDLKGIVKNGVAGYDASVRPDIIHDNRISISDIINK